MNRKLQPPPPRLELGFILIAALVVLCSALYVILSKQYAISTENWAYTMVGSSLATIIGIKR